MQAVAHGNIKPRKGLPPKSVAQDFAAADHKRGATKLPEKVGHAIVQGRDAKDL